ncbi:MAG: hypothetical protein Q9214_001872, partial [Letrouitia sp. 1 TL-2023]
IHEAIHEDLTGKSDTAPTAAEGKPKHRHGEHILGFFKGTTRTGVETKFSVDKVRAKAGSATAKNHLGVLPKAGEWGPSGPVDFKGRYKGHKGWIYISTTANVPAVSWSKEHSDGTGDAESQNAAFSVPIQEIKELKKVGGLGWKAKIVVGWATGKTVADGLEIVDKKGNTWKMTAIQYRDELFNRLLAIGGQKWESCYKKAYDSLKTCPIELHHPSEVLKLNGFGPKICDRLTERLQQYCHENGLQMPKKKSRKRPTGDFERLETNVDLTPAKKPRKSKKPYVPTLRSGAYALIIALSNISENECLSKQQLLELAQPYCDSSFAAPKDSTSFYTAWNSMKTLVDKDFVKESTGSRRRYSLTDEGWEIAERIKQTVESHDKNFQESTTTSRLEPLQRQEERFVDLEDDLGLPPIIADPPVRQLLADILDRESRTGSMVAGQRLGGAIADKFGILGPAKRLDESRQKFKLPPMPQWDVDENARLAARLQAEENGRFKTAGPDFIELLSSPELEREPVTTARTTHLSAQPSHLSPQQTRHSTREETEPIEEPLQPIAKTFIPPAFDPIRLNPGEFTVELLIDNREISSRGNRTHIQTTLEDTKGICSTVRPLPLGDFFWVAKCKQEKLLTHHGEMGDEIALDYIIERKRLDDLCSSMNDGRLDEQKFRLKRLGVRNVVYLIEEIRMSTEREAKYHNRIQSTIASTQVVDGFFLKRTKDIAETIEYLARMTRMLKEIYESKPLLVIPSSVLSPAAHLPLITHLRATQPDTTYHITNSAFASLASKSDCWTVGDIFLRMLMTIRGISGDKAVAIQKVWKTPRAFVQAYRNCKDDRERGEMVEKRLANEAVERKCVKGALSVRVAEIWGSK